MAGTRKKHLVYVVEDNAVYNRIVAEYLKKKHITNVVSFHSGKECLASLENGKYPDIVIQDYALTDMTGIEILKKVKKLSPRTEFVFLTANESTEVAVNTIKYGAYDYIIKDEMALEKVVNKIGKIAILLTVKDKNKEIKILKIMFLAFLFVVVALAFLYFVILMPNG